MNYPRLFHEKLCDWRDFVHPVEYYVDNRISCGENGFVTHGCGPEKLMLAHKEEIHYSQLGSQRR